MMSTVLSPKSSGPVEESGDILHFPLEDILPDGYVFVIHRRQYTLLLVSVQDDGIPRLHAEVVFGESEIPLLKELLSHFPYYAPYEHLYTAWYRGMNYTPEDIDRTRTFLQKALENGTFAKKTRQVRRGVSRVRLKLKPLGFTVHSIVVAGYLLQQKTKRIPGDTAIMHFSLEGILPQGHRLALSPKNQTISHVAVMQESVQVLGEERFAPGEVALVRLLLDNYPYYCPSEVLAAATNFGTDVGEQDVERQRKTLNTALVEGRWSEEMAPVRNLLSRVRTKLRRLGVGLHSIVEIGYILMALPKEEAERKE